WRYHATGGCVFVLNLIVAWDATSLSSALPTIATAMDATALQSWWLGLAFLVAATTFLPLFSILSEIFGRKGLLLSALTFYTVGSFISAVSGNLMGLLLGRALQGLGAGGIVVLSNLIISDLAMVKDRWRWTALLGAIWAIGAVTGPLIGQALAVKSQWRWIFWLNLPFSVLALLILAFFAQLRDAPTEPVLPKLRSIDWLGLVLFTGSLVSFLLGLTWGGTFHTWSDFKTLLPLQLGLVGLVGFCLWSWFSPFASIVMLDDFWDVTSLVSLFGTMIQGMVVFSLLYFLPLYFNIAKSLQATSLLPWTLSFAALAGVSFFLVSKLNYWRPAVWLGWVLTVVGVALMSLITRDSPTGMWVGIGVATGTGIGILYPGLHVASLVNDPADDEKVSIGVTNFTFFQFLGQTLGVAVGTSVFQNEFFKNLKARPFYVEDAALYAKDAVALVVRVRGPESSSTKIQMIDSYVDALRVVWIIMAALAGVALISS
ncbi:MFS general substrate transporter, partial [Corynespora cassiicola Philippines]